MKLRTDNILLLGDAHGNYAFVKMAIDKGIEFDISVIIQLGDFGIWTHRISGVRFLDTVNKDLVTNDMILIFADGNHERFSARSDDETDEPALLDIPIDDDGFRRVRSNIWHAPRGHIFELNDVVFLAMGGAPSIDGPGGPRWWKANFGQGRGPLDDDARMMMSGRTGLPDPGYDLGNWWPEERITEQQVADTIMDIIEYPKSIDVMFGHDCPYGIEIPGIDEDWAIGINDRKLLRQVLDVANPKVYYGGHYHLRHNDKLNDTVIEILAADVNPTDQALAVSLDLFRDE